MHQFDSNGRVAVGFFHGGNEQHVFPKDLIVAKKNGTTLSKLGKMRNLTQYIRLVHVERFVVPLARVLHLAPWRKTFPYAVVTTLVRVANARNLLVRVSWAIQRLHTTLRPRELCSYHVVAFA